MYKLSLFLLGLFSFIVLVMTAARISFVAAILGVVTVLILANKKHLLLLIILIAIFGMIYPSQLRDRFVSTVTVNLLQEGQRFSVTAEEQKEGELNIPTLPRGKKDYFASPSATAKTARDIAPGEPVNTTQLGVYRSFGIRLNQEWPRAVRAFLKNPLLGTGYSSIGVATDSDLLRSFGEVGLLGTGAFLLVLFAIIKMIWRNFKSGERFIKGISIGGVALIFAFLLNGLFIDVFESSKVAALFWMIIGVVLACGKFNENTKIS